MEKVYLNENDFSLKFDVAGIKFLDKSALRRVNNLSLYEEVKLVPEPENKYDSDAIAVKTIDGSMIGYVNSDALDLIHNLLDSGSNYECKISKISDHDIPYIWVLINFDPDNDDWAQDFYEDYR